MSGFGGLSATRLISNSEFLSRHSHYPINIPINTPIKTNRAQIRNQRRDDDALSNSVTHSFNFLRTELQRTETAFGFINVLMLYPFNPTASYLLSAAVDTVCSPSPGGQSSPEKAPTSQREKNPIHLTTPRSIPPTPAHYIQGWTQNSQGPNGPMLETYAIGDCYALNIYWQK